MKDEEKDARSLSDIKAIKPFEEIEISDDFMFGEAMKKEYFCKRFIEILLDTKLSKIEYKEIQKTEKPYLDMKGVRFDAYVEADDTIFEIEMQVGKYDDLIPRARFYQSIIDATSTKKGTKYGELKNTVIIFICKDDPFGKGWVVYEPERLCKKHHDFKMDNGARELYFNASAYKKVENSELRSLLSYINKKQVTDDFTKALDGFVEKLKINKEAKKMYETMQLKLWDERRSGYEIGREEGREEGRAENQAIIDKLIMIIKAAGGNPNIDNIGEDKN